MFSWIVYMAPIVPLLALQQKQPRIGAAFAVLCAAFLLVFRDGVGYDYASYLSHFHAGIFPREPLSFLVTAIATWFETPKLLFAGYGMVTLGFLWRACRVWDYDANVILAYITLPWFFSESFTILRQAAALAAFVAGYAYALKGRNLSASLLFLCAIGFHYSALLGALYVAIWRLPLTDAIKTGVTIAVSATVALGVGALLAFDWSSILPTLQFYDGEHEYGYGLIALAAGMTLLSAMDRRFRPERLAICAAGVCLSVVLTSFDAVLARAGFFLYVPLLFVRWNILLGRNIGAQHIVYLAFCGVYGYMITVRSGGFEGSMIPYRTFLF